MFPKLSTLATFFPTIKTFGIETTLKAISYVNGLTIGITMEVFSRIEVFAWFTISIYIFLFDFAFLPLDAFAIGLSVEIR
jgi:hypothetical protein